MNFVLILIFLAVTHLILCLHFIVRPSISRDIIKDTIYFFQLQLPQSQWPDSQKMNEFQTVSIKNYFWKTDILGNHPKHAKNNSFIYYELFKCA